MITGFRIREKEKYILQEALRRELCENKSQCVRMAIREFAINHGINVEKND